MGEVYTGEIAQSELLGKPEREEADELSYKPYKTAMDVARKTQAYLSSDSKYSPSDPEPRFANDLHATIAEKLGVDNYDDLRYYTALGTELDRFHGVDAFFELDIQGSTEPIIVTLDLTLNPDKDEYKADTILFVDEDQLDIEYNKQGYDELIKDSADKIVRAFRLAQNTNKSMEGVK